jgi:GTP-dependent phosphoenolpyruvate carboxykinase
LAAGALDELLNVEPAAWRAEFEGFASYLAEFGKRVPPALTGELGAALERVKA